jgi:hypothetical protein
MDHAPQPRYWRFRQLRPDSAISMFESVSILGAAGLVGGE